MFFKSTELSFIFLFVKKQTKKKLIKSLVYNQIHILLYESTILGEILTANLYI